MNPQAVESAFAHRAGPGSSVHCAPRRKSVHPWCLWALIPVPLHLWLPLVPRIALSLQTMSRSLASSSHVCAAAISMTRPLHGCVISSPAPIGTSSCTLAPAPRTGQSAMRQRRSRSALEHTQRIVFPTCHVSPARNASRETVGITHTPGCGMASSGVAAGSLGSASRRWMVTTAGCTPALAATSTAQAAMPRNARAGLQPRVVWCPAATVPIGHTTVYRAHFLRRGRTSSWHASLKRVKVVTFSVT